MLKSNHYHISSNHEEILSINLNIILNICPVLIPRRILCSNSRYSASIIFNTHFYVTFVNKVVLYNVLLIFPEITHH